MKICSAEAGVGDLQQDLLWFKSLWELEWCGLNDIVYTAEDSIGLWKRHVEYNCRVLNVDSGRASIVTVQ